MRAPPKVLVVDTSILISALLGASSGVLPRLGAGSALLTTERAIVEARRRVALGLRRPELLDALDDLADLIEVIPMETISNRITAAAAALCDAIPSRNGSTTDAHILALAWETDADIWSHDRDFAGTGVASWSTLNLLKAIAED